MAATVVSQNSNAALPFLPATPAPGIIAEPPPVMIGKHVSPVDQTWMCLGHLEGCGQRFRSLEDLLPHFERYHLRVSLSITQWLCIRCPRVIKNEGVDPGFCPCSVGPNRVLWCFGIQASPATPLFRTRLLVPHYEGPASNYSLTSSSAQHSNWSGDYASSPSAPSWGSYPSPGFGHGYSYNKAAASSLRSHEERKLYRLPCTGGTFPPLGLFSIDSSKTIVLRRFCPAAAVVAVYILACSTGSIDGISPSSLASTLLAHILPDGHINTAALPLVFIVAGWLVPWLVRLAPWLVRHVKTKVFSPRRAEIQVRGCLSVGSSPQIPHPPDPSSPRSLIQTANTPSPLTHTPLSVLLPLSQSSAAHPPVKPHFPGFSLLALSPTSLLEWR